MITYAKGRELVGTVPRKRGTQTVTLGVQYDIVIVNIMIVPVWRRAQGRNERDIIL